MINNYIKRSVMLLGAAALVGASAMAQDSWRCLNNEKLLNPAYIPGWSGGLTATADGVAEVYNGAFDLYQELNDMPAGEYTLTVSAFYRYTNNDMSMENMKDGANHNAYIYLNDAKQAVEGLFDKTADVYPNSTFEADEAFAAGRYANTVKYNHAGGALVVGIANVGGLADEWCCFDNFKLVGPNGDCTDLLVNADFAQGLDVDKNQTIWECTNIDNSKKSPDNNKAGGVYRKTNASPYNIAQCVELEAGTYRFSVQSFLRYGGGTTTTGGWWAARMVQFG